jgi:erythromycin esterase-like protein
MDEYLTGLINAAYPLKGRQNLHQLVNALKGKKIVMLGEASHGTKEFYQWRQVITQKLISQHGFNFIAVEGDWPPCQRINEFVTSQETGRSFEKLQTFHRWLTWMWANHEVEWFINWLKHWNQNVERKVGFHGLDVYSLFESIEQVVSILKKVDPELAEAAQKKYACF